MACGCGQERQVKNTSPAEAHLLGSCAPGVRVSSSGRGCCCSGATVCWKRGHVVPGDQPTANRNAASSPRDPTVASGRTNVTTCRYLKKQIIGETRVRVPVCVCSNPSQKEVSLMHVCALSIRPVLTEHLRTHLD